MLTVNFFLQTQNPHGIATTCGVGGFCVLSVVVVLRVKGVTPVLVLVEHDMPPLDFL